MHKKLLVLLSLVALLLIACPGPPPRRVVDDGTQGENASTTQIATQVLKASPEGQPAPKGKSGSFGAKGWWYSGTWGWIWSPMSKAEAVSTEWENPTPESKPVKAAAAGCYWYPCPWGWIWSPLSPDEAAKLKKRVDEAQKKPAEPDKPSEGTKPAGAGETTEPSGPSKPSEPSDQTEPSEPEEPAEPEIKDFSLSAEHVEVGTAGAAIAQEARVIISDGSGNFEVCSSDSSKAEAVLEDFEGKKSIKILGHAVYEATITVKDTEPKEDGSFVEKKISVEIKPKSYGAFRELETIGTLDKEVEQSSGLIAFDGFLLSHNDARNDDKKIGGEAILYKLAIDNAALVQRIYIDGATNRDWEDLAADEDYIYISDTGNDTGNADAKMYRVSKQAIRDAGAGLEIHVPVDKVFDLEIADMPTDADVKKRAHDWDFESLIISAAKPALIRSQWVTRGSASTFITDTSLEEATLSMSPSTSLAELALDPEFTVTGADYDETNDVLFAVGYRLESKKYKTGIPYETKLNLSQTSYLLVVEGFSRDQQLRSYELDLFAPLMTTQFDWKTFKKKDVVEAQVAYEFDAIALAEDGSLYISNTDLSQSVGTGPKHRLELPAKLHRVIFEGGQP